MNQTYKNWRVYLIDDYSDDHSKKILNKYSKDERINIFFLDKNLGPSYCRNFGLKNSKSEYVAFLDSDDYWPENKLEIQINEMLNNKYEFTYTDIKHFFSDNYKKIKTTDLPKIYDFKNF